MVSRLDDFTTTEIDVGRTTIFVRSSGTGRPVLLLHGFPETHLMWREIAPMLAHNRTVVCADLTGYGRSGCPASTADHEPYTKRAMARDMVAVMERLGFGRFSIAGHDRGGRVAYRLALDHPDRVERLAVLDILPTEPVWKHADERFAMGYWPWTLLAQAEPLPERILAASAAAIVEDALDRWGSPASVFPSDVRAAYVQALSDPSHANAICEEYRAAATLDREHDRTDEAARRRISCPVLVLWSGKGPLEQWYAKDSGPIGVWRMWADDVRGDSLEGGHFFPEELPKQTADALASFFGAANRNSKV
jgi:haloacetate dehalogenase